MKKLTKKQIELKTSELFGKHSRGIQFNVLDLGKVLGAIRLSLQSGEDGEEATLRAIKQYGVNNK